jgi:CubicO group peptidase (beta-lactamase class C family)
MFCTSSAKATLILPTANFATVNASFPIVLAAPDTFADGTSAPFIQLMGCTNSALTNSVDLNETLLAILRGIKIKYPDVPAIGVSIIQTPSLQSYTGTNSLVNSTCPFILVSTVVTGVRRADAVIPEPVTVDDKWHLGSNGKSMTAILIQMLIQAGKLSLTTIVADIFPYLPLSLTSASSLKSCTCANVTSADGYFAKSLYSCGLTIHSSWQNVTIAHLLTHASGLTLDMAFTPDILAEESEMEINGIIDSCTNYPMPSRRYHSSLLLSMAVPNPPSSVDVPIAYTYSNHNYILLGLILEEIWHAPWESIIQQQLFNPLGMSTAGFGLPIKQVPLTSFATQPLGHSMDASTDYDFPKAWAPAGLAHMSLNDWAKFIACHLQEGRDLTPLGHAPENNTTIPPYLFSPPIWRSIHEPYTFPSASTPNFPYSLSGMLIYDDDELRYTLGHDGSNTLWFALVRVHPRLVQPVAFLIAMNVFDTNAATEAITAIYNAYLAWQLQGQP